MKGLFCMFKINGYYQKKKEHAKSKKIILDLNCKEVYYNNCKE